MPWKAADGEERRRDAVSRQPSKAKSRDDDEPA